MSKSIKQYCDGQEYTAYGFYTDTIEETEDKRNDMRFLGEKGHIEIGHNEKGYFCYIVNRDFKN